MFKSAAKKAAEAEAAYKEEERKRKDMLDHECVDYPITFFIASSAKNSGSLVVPRIIAASSVYYGQGHPLNRTEILYPESEGYMPEDSTTGPRMSIITRRALLRGLLQALVAVKDIYRVGRASTCLHICVSSKYLDLVWNDWLPNWEKNGWPTRDEEDELVERRRERGSSFNSNLKAPSNGIRGRERAASRASTRMSVMSRADSALSGMSAMTGDAQLIYDDDSNRLVNEDLLRKIAVFRRNFFSNSPSGNKKGEAYLRLFNYRQNHADKLAKEAVHAAALDLTTQVPRARSMGTLLNNGSIYSASTDSLQPRGSASGNGRIRQGSITSSMSARSPIKKLASLPPAASLAAPLESSSSFTELSHSDNNAAKKRANGTNGTSQAKAKAAPAAAASPPTQPAAPKVAPAAVTAAATAAIAKRPASRQRSRSRDVISEYGTETEFEDFDDAASTLSEPKQPQSTLAKVVALPTAAVATTVAAVMGPAQDTNLLENLSSSKGNDEPVTSGRGSFAKETNEALAAVKAPSKEELLSPDSTAPLRKRDSTTSKRGSTQMGPQAGKTPVVSKRKSSVLKGSTAAAPAANAEATKPTAATVNGSDLTRKKSGNTSARAGAGGAAATAAAPPKTDIKREVSQRSGRSTTGARPAVASKPEPVEPRPQAKQRTSSFFSLRKKKTKDASVTMPRSSSPAPYKPPTDRLIDYRPPQSRNLRNTTGRVGGNEEKLYSQTRSSSTDDMPPPPPRSSAPAAASTGGRTGGPFSFFKRRTSVREVF